LSPLCACGHASRHDHGIQTVAGRAELLAAARWTKLLPILIQGMKFTEGIEASHKYGAA
jgi:hypothetical protein